MNKKNSPVSDPNNKYLGDKIRSRRLEKGLKITELAELTGLTSSSISQVERAVISPSISTLKKICNALDITIGSLFGDSNEITKDEDSQAKNNPTSIQMMALESLLQAFPPVNLYGSSPVVRKEKRKILLPGEGVRFHLLTPNLTGPIGFIYNEYEPGSSTGSGLYSHPGTESGLILSGELVVQIKDESYILSAGDSITFNSSDPHSKKNISNELCTCVWVNVPPWF